MGAGEMKYCRNCGQQISRNAKFCKFCGYQFEVQQEPAAPAMKYCGSCGKENAADAAFCRYCGQPIQQDAAAQQRPAAASSLCVQTWARWRAVNASSTKLWTASAGSMCW